MVDPAFAKNQLDMMTREWYMKPDGALPAYEWNFGGARVAYRHPLRISADLNVLQMSIHLCMPGLPSVCSSSRERCTVEKTSSSSSASFKSCCSTSPGKTLCFVASWRRWLTLPRAGGSTARMQLARVSLKVASSAWTTLVSSTDLRLCPPVVDFVSLMALLGWLSMLSLCKFFFFCAHLGLPRLLTRRAG